MSETAASTDEMKSRLELALASLPDSDEVILEHFQSADLNVDRKSDASPVTIADREAEVRLRKRITAAFPEDGILGEEFESVESKNGWRWILDPIDGTKSFIHGVPLFGTLIGIEFEGVCVVGVCRFTALDETVYAWTGGGSWWTKGDGEPQRARVSETSELDEALFCTTTIKRWRTIGRQEAYEHFVNGCGLARGWGDCYGHILVATGRAEIMVDPVMSAWDAAALVPIVREAGGHFLDWSGVESIETGNGVSVNAALRDHVIGVLSAS